MYIGCGQKKLKSPDLYIDYDTHVKEHFKYIDPEALQPLYACSFGKSCWKKFLETNMPNYSYRCKECDEEFEIFHGMTEKPSPCPNCKSEELKKLVSTVAFKVEGGSEKSECHAYTGRHRDLVKKRKGNKNYRDGHRKEVQRQEKIGLADWREEQKQKSAQNMFEKMREEGAKMTNEEKEKLKAEYGIKKGKTNANEIKF
jgi:putative FmdB family regulatory protein